MALTACRECGREVSTEAVNCPHCGAPRPAAASAAVPSAAAPSADRVAPPVERRRGSGIGTIVAVVLALAAVAAVLWYFGLIDLQ